MYGGNKDAMFFYYKSDDFYLLCNIYGFKFSYFIIFIFNSGKLCNVFDVNPSLLLAIDNILPIYTNLSLFLDLTLS